jgi:hypothetical protein
MTAFMAAVEALFADLNMSVELWPRVRKNKS